MPTHYPVLLQSMDSCCWKHEKNVIGIQDVYKHCDYLQSMHPAPENYSVCFSLIKNNGGFFIFSAQVLLRSVL